jgi:hypothetical protein
VDAWTDSELREFLLKNGIVAPSSKAEELRILAKQQLEKTPGFASQASASASSLGAQATAALGEAYYASADAPRLAYDYLSNAFDETKDYVYSSWSDSDLRSYLESKGVVKTPVEAKRDDLVSQVKGLYNDAADNVYDTWSDTYLVSWPSQHWISLHTDLPLLTTSANGSSITASSRPALPRPETTSSISLKRTTTAPETRPTTAGLTLSSESGPSPAV